MGVVSSSWLPSVNLLVPLYSSGWHQWVVIAANLECSLWQLHVWYPQFWHLRYQFANHWSYGCTAMFGGFDHKETSIYCDTQNVYNSFHNVFNPNSTVLQLGFLFSFFWLAPKKYFMRSNYIMKFSLLSWCNHHHDLCMNLQHVLILPNPVFSCTWKSVMQTNVQRIYFIVLTKIYWFHNFYLTIMPQLINVILLHCEHCSGLGSKMCSKHQCEILQFLRVVTSFV